MGALITLTWRTSPSPCPVAAELPPRRCCCTTSSQAEPATWPNSPTPNGCGPCSAAPGNGQPLPMPGRGAHGLPPLLASFR